MQKFRLVTTEHSQMVNITNQVREAVRAAGADSGIAVVFCPHTTAGITLNEGADPDVVRDILLRLAELYPRTHPQYRHGEGNSAAHLKASAVGSSQMMPVAGGEIILGRWQVVYFCEFDGPRERTFFVQVLGKKISTAD
ncbi:MAG: secondary thiamine-phosphate synthase enzyme YjbQ [bacterium]|jgi:secondary thiamine-phosphate synthase enzyme